ncbi:hypothetical protein E2320_016667 [Naja naja]|nr:hypothetical protein E2320_016667 [Naja naja]
MAGATQCTSSRRDKELHNCICRGIPDHIHDWYRMVVAINRQQRGSPGDSLAINFPPSRRAAQGDLNNTNQMLLLWPTGPLSVRIPGTVSVP